MSLTLRSKVVVGVVSGLVAVAVLVWTASQSAASSSEKSSSVSSAAAGPSNNFGFSKATQAKIDRLNAELEGCLLHNGAERVPLAGGGWTYTDPEGRPSAACARVQARVNAFANGEEYQSAVAAVLPAVEAYADCLSRNGVSPTHGARSANEQAALAKAHVACGGTAEAATASG